MEVDADVNQETIVDVAEDVASAVMVDALLSFGLSCYYACAAAMTVGVATVAAVAVAAVAVAAVVFSAAVTHAYGLLFYYSAVAVMDSANNPNTTPSPLQHFKRRF